MFRLCENEGVKMGLYRVEERGRVRLWEAGFGWESGLNLNGEVVGVL